MKKYFILLSFLPTALLAQTIGVDVAQNKALQFLQSQPQTRALQQEVQLSLAYTSQAGDETYYYVFNNAAGGYVIMGGDEAAQEVLGYSDKGTFDYARIPDNMRWWLSQYDAEISHTIGEVKAGRSRIAKAPKTRASWPNIPAMLTTEWGQNEPYNCQIPTYAAGYTGKNALLTGCVPTAAAQVMKYYEWPDVGVGSATLSQEYDGLQFEADFEHTHYDWAHMTDTYTPGTYTGSEEEIAVGTLMYHLGVAINASYSTVGTSANDEILMDRLADTFKYNKGMTYAVRKQYSDTEWEQMIYNELLEGRPVLYGGSGHEFVCDGYEDGRWHINWGWNGSNNATFLLTASATEEALRPAGTGTGGASANSSYSVGQVAIIGLYPDKEGTTEYNRDTFDLVSFRFHDIWCFQPGEEINVSWKITNHVLTGKSLQFKYKLVNQDDEDDVLMSSDITTINVPPGKISFFDASFTIPTEVKRGATYLIVPMMKDEQGEWKSIASKLQNYDSNLVISPWSGIGSDVDNAFRLENNGYASVNCPIGTASVENYGLETLTQPLVIWVYPEEGGDSIDYFDLGEVTLESKAFGSLDFGYQDLHSQTLPGQPQTLVPGRNYLLRLQNLTTGELMESILLHLCESMTIEYALPETGWGTICLPFTPKEEPEDITVYFPSEIVDDKLSLYAISLYCNYPFIIQGTPGATYRFSGPDAAKGIQTKNFLTSSTEGDIYAPKGSYVLQCRDGLTGFYKVQEDNQVLVKQYEAYLVPDKECGDFISLGEYYEPPTAIESISTHTVDRDTQTYDLFGNEVDEDYRGIVIRKGKKIMNKISSL